MSPNRISGGVFGVTNVADQASSLLLITGRAKSGTTYCSNLLRSHPNLAVPGDADQEPLAFSRFRPTSWDLASSFLPPQSIEFYRQRDHSLRQRSIAAWAQEHRNGCTYVVAKSPDTSLPEYLEAFPAARVIVMLRDLRDTCISLAHHAANAAGTFEPYFLDESREVINPVWVRASQAAYEQSGDILEYLTCARDHKNRVLLVRYEDLVSKPDAELRRVFGWLGVDDTAHIVAGCLEEGSFSKWAQGRQPGERDNQSFYRRGLPGEWRQALHHRAAKVFNEVAGRTLIIAGYERSYAWDEEAKEPALSAAGNQGRPVLVTTHAELPWNEETGGVQGWVRTKPSSLMTKKFKGSAAGPIDLKAIIGAWQEADIIEACVKNALHQGCSEVFLLDNGSQDDTVAIAEASGAKVVEIWRSDYYHDGDRLRRMNRIAHEVSARLKLPHLWWLYLDADELPRAHRGLTIRAYLETLPAPCNIVGADAVDHYPTDEPHYLPGFHPADFQPLATFRQGSGGSHSFCSHNHWKHPLFRVDSGEMRIAPTRGSHVPEVFSRHSLVEPSESLLIHHCPLRQRAASYSRLEQLCGPRESLDRRSLQDDEYIKSDGAIRRYQSLDAIYSQNWKKVLVPHSRLSKLRTGISPKPWWELVSKDYHSFSVWYSRESLREAVGIDA